VIDEQLITDPKDPNWGLTAPPKQEEAKPPVSRVGVATSVIAPELEATRGAMNDALAVPRGASVMARSRTGNLYASETGTGAVDAAKSFVKGAGNVAVDTAEGATSPLGMITMAGSKVASMLPSAETIAKGTKAALNAGPDLVGIFSPRVANALRVAQKVVDAAQEAAPAKAPKLSINAMDFMRIKSLIDQGIPQGEAVSTVMNLRVKGMLK